MTFSSPKRSSDWKPHPDWTMISVSTRKCDQMLRPLHIPWHDLARRAAVLISLVLCLATCALWLRSYRNCDVLVRQHSHADRWCITSEFGALVFERETEATPSPKAGWSYFVCSLPRRWPVQPSRAGFDLYRSSNRHYVHAPPTPLAGVVVAHWAFLALFMVFPLIQLRRWRRQAVRRRRVRENLCPSCGYDLRTGHERCPECGEPSVAQSSSSGLSARRGTNGDGPCGVGGMVEPAPLTVFQTISFKRSAGARSA